MTDTFLQRIEAPFIKLWDDIKAEVAIILPKLEAFAEDFVSTAVADVEHVFAAGVPIAVEAVIEQAPKVASGQEKFGNAVTSVMQQLETQLGPVAIADVQALVQTVYRSIQAAVLSKA